MFDIVCMYCTCVRIYTERIDRKKTRKSSEMEVEDGVWVGGREEGSYIARLNRVLGGVLNETKDLKMFN